MTRFGGRAFVALAFWLGLAIEGQGPRASASFLPFVTQVPQSGSAAESWGAGGGPAELLNQIEVPPSSDVFAILQTCNCERSGPASGGAGSVPHASSGSTGCAAMTLTVVGLSGPSITTRLRSPRRSLNSKSHHRRDFRTSAHRLLTLVRKPARCPLGDRACSVDRSFSVLPALFGGAA